MKRTAIGWSARSLGLSLVLHVAAITGAVYVTSVAAASDEDDVEVTWVRVAQSRVPPAVLREPEPAESPDPPVVPPHVPVELEQPLPEPPPEPEPAIPDPALDAGQHHEPDPTPEDWLSPVLPEPAANIVAAPEPPRPAVLIEAHALKSQNVPPRYPEDAQRRGEEGTVVVNLLIDVEGRVRDARVITSSGWADLDRVAMEQLRQWRFEPARRDGVAIESWFRQPIVFRLVR